MENDYANDNEPNPWSTIGLQAALIVNKLRISAQLSETDKQKQEDAGGDADSSGGNEKKEREQRAYIEQRLRELAAFERRVSGNKN